MGSCVWQQWYCLQERLPRTGKRNNCHVQRSVVPLSRKGVCPRWDTGGFIFWIVLVDLWLDTFCPCPEQKVSSSSCTTTLRAELKMFFFISNEQVPRQEGWIFGIEAILWDQRRSEKGSRGILPRRLQHLPLSLQRRSLCEGLHLHALPRPGQQQVRCWQVFSSKPKPKVFEDGERQDEQLVGNFYWFKITQKDSMPSLCDMYWYVHASVWA